MPASARHTERCSPFAVIPVDRPFGPGLRVNVCPATNEQFHNGEMPLTAGLNKGIFVTGDNLVDRGSPIKK